MNVEHIMELICDNCHWPYVEAQEWLDERCEACPIVAAIRRLAEKED